MPSIRYLHHVLPLIDGESVLDTLLRHNIAINHTCKTGVCRRCIVQAVDGDIPPFSQRTLAQHYRDNNMFMACVCRPDQDMAIAIPATGSYVKASDYRQGIEGK